jgi:hypothetical protein
VSEKSRWEQFKEKNGGVTPFDLLNPNSPKANDTLSSSRMEICSGCEKFITVTKQCLQCGCFMNMKTRLLNAKCPLGKW